jgi:hypothetical protein
VGNFRYVSLGGAISLAPGNYVIGAEYGENVGAGQLDYVITWANPVTAFTTVPQITFIEDRQENTAPGATQAVFATFSASHQPSYFGPNFQFADVVSTTAVPEPATLVLLGSALIGVAAIRRRRKSTTN